MVGPVPFQHEHREILVHRRDAVRTAELEAARTHRTKPYNNLRVARAERRRAHVEQVKAEREEMRLQVDQPEGGEQSLRLRG